MADRRTLTFLLAVLMVVGLVAGCGHDASRPSSHAPPDRSELPIGTIPAPTTAGHNRALAVAAATRVLASIPLPPGATATSAAPVPRLRHLGVYDWPVDATLTRTRWWVVPLGYRQLVPWYAAHSPANPRTTYGPDSPRPQPVADLSWRTSVQSGAFSEPAVVVSYARLDRHRTALRTDVTLAARYDRVAATLVPESVTTIGLASRSVTGGDPHPAHATITDPALRARIVTAFDLLSGAMAHASPEGCGSPAGELRVYTLTFHWPGHVLVVTPGAPLCGIGRGLRLDGAQLRQTLQDDDTFDTVLEAALRAS